MFCGTISENYAINGGGIRIAPESTFNMYGGDIINNEGIHGGGIVNESITTIFGGRICGNTATYAGGVNNNNSSVFTMFGGEKGGENIFAALQFNLFFNCRRDICRRDICRRGICRRGICRRDTYRRDTYRRDICRGINAGGIFCAVFWA